MEISLSPKIELQSALKAMRIGGINIVAIHSHMTHKQPRILFFHYWGKGPAKKLAEADQECAPRLRLVRGYDASIKLRCRVAQ